MFISKIKLANYRSWVDQEIDFPYMQPSGKTVVVFSGKIGAGKTSLFNSIGWCLNGKESQELLGSKSHEKKVPSDLGFDKNGIALVRVEIEVLTPENPDIRRFTMMREEKYQRGVNEPIYSDVSLDIYYDGRVESLSSKDREGETAIASFLRTLFPEILSRFYFFDGEFLVQTYSERGANVEGALKGMFKIGSIVSLSKEIDSVWQDYVREISKLKNNEKLVRLQEVHKEAQELYNNLEGELVRTAEEIDRLKDEIEQLRLDMENLAAQMATAKKAEADFNALVEKQHRQEQLENEVEQLKLELWRSTLRLSPRLNLRKEFSKSIDLIERVAEKGDLPPRIKETFVKDLLSEGNCLCGTPIPLGSRGRACVEKYLTESKIAENRAVLLEIRPMLNSYCSSEQESAGLLRSLQEQIVTKMNEISAIKSETSKITNTKFDEGLRAIIEMHDRKKSEMAAKVSLRDSRIRKREEFRQKLAEQERIMESAQEAIRRESAKVDGAKQKSALVSLSEKLRKIFQAVPAKLLEAFARRIEEITNEQIETIPELKNKVARVLIDESRKLDFHLEENGYVAYLTGGQSQIAGKLLISSFVRVVGELNGFLNMPFIAMDHPFSNYDSAAKTYMPSRMSTLFKGAQIILFLPDTEVHDFIKNSNGCVAKAYWLTRDESTGTKVSSMGLP